MANDEHLKILKEGVERWNAWRKENKDIIPDLTAANLEAASLYGADLNHAKLTRANLFSALMMKTNLNAADLTSADLTNTNLSGANLIAANLRLANMRHAILDRASLNYAGLRDANLKSAKLNGTDFKRAVIGHTIFSLTDLSNCLNMESVEVYGPCSIDFQTLRASPNLTKSFLLKIGLPELYIDYLPDFFHDGGIKYYPAFLSHSWANKPFARKLYEALIARGVNVFFDEKKMKPGDDIYESISRGIDYYDKMILVCSKESLEGSWWVDREIDRILAKERDLFKEVGRRVNLLIPITIDDYVFNGWNGAKKEEVKRYFIGDFKNWQDDAAFEDSLNKLIHTLNVDRMEIKPVSHLPQKSKS